MGKSVTLYAGTESQTFNINFPEVCGACRKKSDPKFLQGILVNSDLSMELVFQCNKCKSLIIGYYQRSTILDAFKLVYIAPSKPEENRFSSEIMVHSPKFIKVYNQLLIAEQSGLDTILGIGYKMALEILIKDYLGYIEPQNKMNIKSVSLKDSIALLGNNNINGIYKRVSWLENNDDIYKKQLQRKDINDLKKMIEVVSSYFTINIKLKKQLEKLN